MYSVNVDFADEEIIELYHKHGEMEQYHSEIKTDLNAEQLPSGKFSTNGIVNARINFVSKLPILCYNDIGGELCVNEILNPMSKVCLLKA